MYGKYHHLKQYTIYDIMIPLLWIENRKYVTEYRPVRGITMVVHTKIAFLMIRVI